MQIIMRKLRHWRFGNIIYHKGANEVPFQFATSFEKSKIKNAYQ